MAITAREHSGRFGARRAGEPVAVEDEDGDRVSAAAVELRRRALRDTAGSQVPDVSAPDGGRARARFPVSVARERARRKRGDAPGKRAIEWMGVLHGPSRFAPRSGRSSPCRRVEATRVRVASREPTARASRRRRSSCARLSSPRAATSSSRASRAVRSSERRFARWSSTGRSWAPGRKRRSSRPRAPSTSRR